MCTLFNEYMQEVIKYLLHAAILNLIFAPDLKLPFIYICFTSDFRHCNTTSGPCCTEVVTQSLQ